MTEPEDKHDDPSPELHLQRLRCNRTGQQYSLDTHERCPYCWGSRERIERGKHEGFCDYDPDRDPIHFGFPDGTARHTRG